MSDDLADTVYDVVGNNCNIEGSFRYKSIIETELVSEEARDAVWKVFEILNRQKKLVGSLPKDKFDAVWSLCTAVVTALLRYEDWPNAARFMHQTQHYKTFGASRELTIGKLYLELPILKDKKFWTTALSTFIEVGLCHAGPSPNLCAKVSVVLVRRDPSQKSEDNGVSF